MRSKRLLPILLVAVLGACSDEPSPGTDLCQTDADCPEGQICHGGVCRGECTTSNDCPGDQMCVSGVCLQTCQADGDCPDGQSCQNGFCAPDVPVDGGVDAGGGDDAGGDGSPQTDAGADPDFPDAGSDAGPDASDPGPVCPSGIWCGSPAVCCLAAEECYQGACVPICPSGIRCGEDGLTCCPDGDVCLAHTCVTPTDSCADSFDCPEGYFCEPTIGACLPQIIDDVCEYLPEFDEFEPLVEWHWEGYSQDLDIHNVAVSPAVADLDADGIPEVAFGAYAKDRETSTMLVVLSGLDGTEELTIPASSLSLTRWSGVALGNLDADPELEIVLCAHQSDWGDGVLVLEHDGSHKWHQNSGSLSGVAGDSQHAYPSLANLDADPFPEVVVGGVALDDSDGSVIFDHGMIGCNSTWCMSAVADLDMDGEPEVVGGNRAYSASGIELWHQSAVADGFPAVADMDRDGAPDVVNVTSGQVYVLRGSDGGILFGPVSIPGGGNGGAPTVADFDGDGRMEFSTAGQGYYAVYDLDCQDSGDPGFCPSSRTDGVLWEVVTQDISSSITGSSVFDFEGDGNAEVVYNDECHLYVLDGLTGETRLYMANSSRTAAEYPLVVDVDGDNNSEFLVPANNDKIDRDECDPPGQLGMLAFGDTHDRWMRTRRVWNQHSYHVTNVLPNGDVPASEPNNWEIEGLNNYRQNVQGEGVYNAPDLVIAGLEVSMGTGCQSLQIRAHVANHGALGVYPGVPVAFYLGVPYTGELLGVKYTTIPLLPGQSEILTLEYVFPPGDQGPWDFYVTADDDGQGQGTHSECIEDNNTATITEAECFQ